MSAVLETIVIRWLRKMKMGVSAQMLRDKLQSHTDFPSLRSISDVLDELRIDNAALQIDKDRLQEAPLPFLAHDAARAGFVIIDDIDRQVKGKPDFEKNWNGTAMLAEMPEGWKHAENEKRLKEEKASREKILTSVLIIAGLVLLCLVNGFSLQLTLLLISSLAGLGITTLIIQHELGISSELGEKLCGTEGGSGCDAVMHSKGSRLGKWMNWADAGIIYFTAYTLLLVIGVYTGSGVSALAMVSAAAIPLTVFSLYYQWRVVKKWCRLCLLVVGVLWVQFALLLPVTLSLSKGDVWELIIPAGLLLTGFIYASISGVWLLLIKPALQNNRQLLAEKFALLRFKNNPVVFEALLQQQRRVDTTPFDHDLQLGNPEAPIQIMIACNPYCGPCAHAHEALDELLCTTDVGLTVRFTIKADSKDDKKTQTVEYILKLLANKEADYKKKALHDWYEKMSYEKFIAAYPLTDKNEDAAEQLTEHDQWSKEADIKFTPTIFINGFELPKQYRASDLGRVLRYVEKADTILPVHVQAVENNYAPA